MGLVSHRMKKEKIKLGDHIYTYRASYTYSHHGICVAENKVVHFTPDSNSNVCSSSSSCFNLPTGIPPSCSSFDKCGFRQPNNGVIMSCLDCFLGKGSPYLYDYGVYKFTLLVKLRGGTCTTAQSDQPETVIHRAMRLLEHGFGNFDVCLNNCEDFALYCKTGLLDKKWCSGQAISTIGGPCAAIIGTASGLLVPPVAVGAATLSALVFLITRYGSDIGVRSAVTKVPVEDLTVNRSYSGREGVELVGAAQNLLQETGRRRNGFRLGDSSI